MCPSVTVLTAIYFVCKAKVRHHRVLMCESCQKITSFEVWHYLHNTAALVLSDELSMDKRIAIWVLFNSVHINR